MRRISFGARTYNASIGRFDGVDPLASIAGRFSPYVYTNNNPLRFVDPDGMASEDFTYSDGYSNLSARNSSGSVGFSGAYTTNRQEGCPPNCGGYGGGDPNTPYNAGTHFKPVSQQNATIKQGKLDNFTPEEKAAHLGVDMASAVEGGAGLLKGGASLLKNGSNFIKSTKAAKTETKGGLNLFKFGAKQTKKSEGWQTGDRMLKMYDQGSPKLNWKQNSGFLRQEMGAGNPIFDSYHLLNGNLIPTKGFLNAERYLLESRGWVYSPVQRAWLPPIR